MILSFALAAKLLKMEEDFPQHIVKAEWHYFDDIIIVYYWKKKPAFTIDLSDIDMLAYVKCKQYILKVN